MKDENPYRPSEAKEQESEPSSGVLFFEAGRLLFVFIWLVALVVACIAAMT